jgi:hypothetical protein
MEVQITNSAETTGLQILQQLNISLSFSIFSVAYILSNLSRFKSGGQDKYVFAEVAGKLTWTRKIQHSP